MSRLVVLRQEQSLSPFISDHIDALFHALTGGWCQMTFSQIKAASTVRQQLVVALKKKDCNHKSATVTRSIGLTSPPSCFHLHDFIISFSQMAPDFCT